MSTDREKPEAVWKGITWGLQLQRQEEISVIAPSLQVVRFLTPIKHTPWTGCPVLRSCPAWGDWGDVSSLHKETHHQNVNASLALNLFSLRISKYYGSLSPSRSSFQTLNHFIKK